MIFSSCIPLRPPLPPIPPPRPSHPFPRKGTEVSKREWGERSVRPRTSIGDAGLPASWAEMEVAGPPEVCDDGGRDKAILRLLQVLLVNLCEGTFLMSVSIGVQTPFRPSTNSIIPVSSMLHLFQLKYFR